MPDFARVRRFTLCAVLTLPLAAQAGYENLQRQSDPVLHICNPDDSAASSTCRVTGLPGVSGYQLVASSSTPIVVNDVTIGTLHEKVWRKPAEGKNYIFGTRIELTAEPWDASGLAFNANDVFRRTLRQRTVSAAYFQDDAPKALRYVGRTQQGLNEHEDDEGPEADNTWVDFGVDVNAADPGGVSSPTSPWLLLRVRARNGIELDPFAIRILNSDTPDPTQAVEIFLPGYQPVGVPIGDDDDEDEDDAPR